MSKRSQRAHDQYTVMSRAAEDLELTQSPYPKMDDLWKLIESLDPVVDICDMVDWFSTMNENSHDTYIQQFLSHRALLMAYVLWSKYGLIWAKDRWVRTKLAIDPRICPKCSNGSFITGRFRRGDRRDLEQTMLELRFHRRV